MNLKTVIAGAAGLAVVLGGAFVAASMFLAVSTDEALDLVPKDAILYANVFVEPSKSQQMAMEDLFKRLPETANDFEEAKDALVELLDPELEKVGLSYSEDLEPALGDQVALFLLPPASGEPPEQGAALFAIEDRDAAQRTLDKLVEHQGADLEERSYEGVEYRLGDDPVTGVDESEGATPIAVGFVGDFLVYGSEEGFKASVDASKGDSLAESEPFTRTTDKLEDDKIALMYLDVPALVDAGLSGAAADPDQVAAETLEQLEALEESGAVAPVSFALFAKPEGAVLEIASVIPKDGDYAGLYEIFSADEEVLSTLPGDSWLAIGVPDLGQTVGTIIDLTEKTTPELEEGQVAEEFEGETGLDLEEDVLSWMGDLGIYFEGTSLPLGVFGGVVLESSDPAKTQAVVGRIEQFITAQEGAVVSRLERGDLSGFSVQNPGMPAPLSFLGGDRMIVAYGPDAAEDAAEPGSTLADNEVFKRALAALGGEFTASFYMDLSALPKLTESFFAFSGAPGADIYEDQVKPWFEVADFAVAGSRVEDGVGIQRFVLGAKARE